MKSRRWIVVLSVSVLLAVMLGFFMIKISIETKVEPADKQEKSALIEDPIQIFAHRGAKDRANEATIAAYDLAAQDGSMRLRLIYV
ncbi:hypothetical protein [Bacillus sp. JCM 19041]|uniref:hypothetical protein n=1 Tax=Bacillus sp. JCM 19041 TaxID=1460637 RepID=UPI0006D078CD